MFMYQRRCGPGETPAWETQNPAIIIVKTRLDWIGGPKGNQYRVCHRPTDSVIAYTTSRRKAKLIAAVCNALPVPWASFRFSEQAMDWLAGQPTWLKELLTTYRREAL